MANSVQGGENGRRPGRLPSLITSLCEASYREAGREHPERQQEREDRESRATGTATRSREREEMDRNRSGWLSAGRHMLGRGLPKNTHVTLGSGSRSLPRARLRGCSRAGMSGGRSRGALRHAGTARGRGRCRAASSAGVGAGPSTTISGRIVGTGGGWCRAAGGCPSEDTRVAGHAR